MEHALYIRSLHDLSFLEKYGFDRIYFGNEFCEKLIPTKEELDEMIGYSKKEKIPLTFVTPWLTDEGVNNLESLFSILPIKTEVVFNDWGVLELIQKYNHIPVLGRLLVSIKRDPRIYEGMACYEQKKTSNINNKEFQEFLSNNGVSRVDLDNVKQEYRFDIYKNLKFSVYYPYVYITTSRKCISAMCVNKNHGVKNYNCNYECTKLSFTASIGDNKERIILKGNSQFHVNKNKPRILNKEYVNRMVFIPKLPFDIAHEKKWDIYYQNNSKNASWGHKYPDDHVVNFVEYYAFSSNIKVLDVGCGHGKNSEFFVKKGYDVFGVDISSKAIEYCNSRIPQANFEEVSASSMKFEKRSFDLICDAGCLHVCNPKNHEHILKKYYELLKDNGRLFIRIFYKRESDKNPIFHVDNLPVYGYSEKEAITIIKKTGFKIDKKIFDKNYGPKNGCYFFYLKK